MLSVSISAEIDNEEYHCLICTNEIGPASKIWSCPGCWRVYDLKCIKDWSSRKPEENWRCPHCAKSFASRRLKYRCWCGKQQNPERLPHLPHSCGQTCGAKLNCPHPCTQICHPGPHQECSAMGPKVSCFCGKHKVQTTCSNTPYNGFSCEKVCGKPLKCKLHSCRQKCHRRGCRPCRAKVKASCYCGKETKTIQCSKVAQDSKGPGGFSCDSICGAPLDCGNHFCQKPCHMSSSHRCDLKPKSHEMCHCRKFTVKEIIGRPRDSCLEPIPSCGKVCGRTLACGHECREKCHPGACPSCETRRTVVCQCGSNKFEIKCGAPAPQCQKKCGALLLCTRHRCEKLCCPFSNSQSTKKGRKRVTLDEIMSDLSISEEESAAHMCTEVCNKLLSCRQHRCRQLCHPGSCAPCLRSSSEDYFCPCGKTHLMAPIRCGTPIPDCASQCHRVRECGHQSLHRCHEDSEPCPPCQQTVFVKCVCGRHNVPVRCLNREPRQCVYECDKVLSCGHKCRTVCHSGECPPCESQCLRKYPCGHEHTAKCHGSTPCGECTAQVVALCPCGHLACKYECGEDVEVFCNETCLNTEPPYADVLLKLYESETGWCRAIEDETRKFVAAADENRHWFKPMKKHKRRFVHYLIEHYGLKGTSMDYGPNRAVLAIKTAATWMPNVKLARAIRLARLHGVSLPPQTGEEDDDFDSS